MTSSWTLLASHGTVLCFLASNPDATMKQTSEALGLTERRIAQIVKELAEAEVISIQRVGRRNVYEVNRDARFPEPTLSTLSVGSLVQLLETNN